MLAFSVASGGQLILVVVLRERDHAWTLVLVRARRRDTWPSPYPALEASQPGWKWNTHVPIATLALKISLYLQFT
jgi:hypothetical protein